MRTGEKLHISLGDDEESQADFVVVAAVAAAVVGVLFGYSLPSILESLLATLLVQNRSSTETICGEDIVGILLWSCSPHPPVLP